MNEDDRVEMLTKLFGAVSSPNVTLGIGDDAAVIDGELVWTIDAQIEGTHFDHAWLTWEDIGYRSVMAAASDLAAMGAAPIAALTSLAIPKDIEDAAFHWMAHGQAVAAREIGAPIIGGNLARDTKTSLTTTWIGRAKKPVTRSGARPGDGLYVAGPLGLGAEGLASLQLGKGQAPDAIAAWRRPRARIAEGLAMSAIATSAIDVSDGLARDARHLAKASGVLVVLDEAALRAYASSPLEYVLVGGEDYALLVTSAQPIQGFTKIGSIEAGNADVVLENATGRSPIASRGFDHFAP